MPKKIREETKQRATRPVLDHLRCLSELDGRLRGGLAPLCIGAELLPRWVRQAQVDAGDRAGVTSFESERIRRLERGNRELCEANEMAD
ncbi:hypothetical protein [Leifsonia aquatica]|uniref:hypothetical protein n=1 Tax=Leifsonia aquatica TaxID=144185 RepID=UPI0006945A65